MHSIDTPDMPRSSAKTAHEPHAGPSIALRHRAQDTDTRSPRILFVGRSIGHLSYYESIIVALLQRGANVELALDSDWSGRWTGGEAALKEFSQEHPDLTTSWLLRRQDKYRNFVFSLRELRSYRSYLVRAQTTPYYVRRWQSYIDKKLRTRLERPLIKWLFKSPLGEFAMQLTEAMVPSDPTIVRYLKEKRPDIVMASPVNMRFSEEADYVKTAKRLGIPTAMLVQTWDSLTTKGLIQVSPNLVFLWNEYQYRDAIDIHKISPTRIRIAGSPFFDKWFDPSKATSSRTDFCRAIGFDPSRPILLYLGSSKNIARDESWFVELVKQRLAKCKDPRLKSFQILVRPHPVNAEVYRRLSKDGLVVWPENGAMPETKQDFLDMRNSFFHADAALGVNTSGMIDSVLANVPTFSILLPKYAETQSNSSHFRYLQEDGAFYLMSSVEEFIEALAGVLDGVDPRAENRRAFAEKFARPNGLERSAGDVIAEALISLASR